MSLTSITGSFSFAFVGNESLLLDSQNLQANPALLENYSFVNGLIAVPDACDLHLGDFGPTGTGRVLAPSASVTYVLSAALDRLSRTIPFLHIKVLVIDIVSRTAGDHIVWGPGVTNGWTGLLASGTMPVWRLMVHVIDKVDSIPVTSGSNDQLTLSNAGSNPMTYKLLLLGCSG
jgi:hypothetical protein